VSVCVCVCVVCVKEAINEEGYTFVAAFFSLQSVVYNHKLSISLTNSADSHSAGDKMQKKIVTQLSHLVALIQAQQTVRGARLQQDTIPCTYVVAPGSRFLGPTCRRGLWVGLCECECET
jgi:extradiol dioxygenase family protein